MIELGMNLQPRIWHLNGPQSGIATIWGWYSRAPEIQTQNASYWLLGAFLKPF